MSSNVIEELAARMAAGQVSGKSEFKVRDDKARTKERVRKIPRTELALGKTSKFLIAKEAAFPFNPATGVADDEFNGDNKYRPMLSVYTICAGMKILADQNPELKKSLLRATGIEIWDTSGPLSFENDYPVFKPYISARFFTMNIVRVNDTRITGRDYAQEFTLDVVRNSLGEIEGEYPLILKINKLYRDLRQVEVQKVSEKRKLAQEGKTIELPYERPEFAGINWAAIKDDDFKEKVLRPIRRDVPVSDDNPVNSVVGDELVLNSDMEFVDLSKIGSYTMEDMERSLRLIKCNENVDTGLTLYKTGSLKNMDRYWDFYELEMECPAEIKNPSNNQKRDLGKQTTYNKSTVYLRDYAKATGNRAEYPDLENKVVELFRKQQDSDEHFERRFMVSSYARPVTEELERQLLDLIEVDNILEHPYMSKQVIQYNAEVLSLAYGDRFQKVLAKLDLDLVPQGMLDVEYDQLEARRAAKEVELETLLEGTGDEYLAEGETEDNTEESGAVDGTDVGVNEESLSLD